MYSCLLHTDLKFGKLGLRASVVKGQCRGLMVCACGPFCCICRHVQSISLISNKLVLCLLMRHAYGLAVGQKVFELSCLDLNATAMVDFESIFQC